MTLVEARSLSKHFGRVKAVDDVSFTVARGEVTGFLGPNGAGKSTTMKMLTGFLPPDAGAAFIGGFDVGTDALEAKRQLGYLPEGAPAYADMTVAEYLQFIGRMRGLSRAVLRERTAEMVERVQLATVWNRRIENLSKGFARRVGIAQALLHDPDVLILDEPTDGLDPNQKHEMRRLVRAIAPQKAIIISTHILEEVEAVCTRAIIIDEGRIVADRTPHEFVQPDMVGVRLQVLVPAAQVELVVSSLQPMQVVSSVRVIERLGGSARVLIEASDSDFSPADVIACLGSARVVLHEIGHHRPRLEEVFREITRGTESAA